MILEGTTLSIERGNPSAKIFVIAKDYKAFTHWCTSVDINHRSSMVVFLRRPSDLQREVNGWFKNLGTTFEQSQWVYPMVDRYKKTRGFKEIP